MEEIVAQNLPFQATARAGRPPTIEFLHCLAAPELLVSILNKRCVMKRFLKIGGIVLASIIIALIIFIYVYIREAIHFEKHTPEEIASSLTPYFQIKHPPGDGLFPAVICFHGSGGLFYPNGEIPQGTLDWADYFVSLGYACILVDSYTGRGYTDNDLNKISEGRKFWGPEYAGYVLTAITEVRKLAFVNPNQLVIMGKSLGGWAIMSLLEMDLNEKLPPSLSELPFQPIAGVKGAILLYPCCPPFDFLDSGGNNWDDTIKTLVLMGGKDPLTKSCLKKLSIIKEKGKHIFYHVYPSANHSYDISQEDYEKILEWYKNSDPPDLEATADSRERIKNFLLEVFTQQ
jgi:dienelactone hydrolase